MSSLQRKRPGNADGIAAVVAKKTTSTFEKKSSLSSAPPSLTPGGQQRAVPAYANFSRPKVVSASPSSISSAFFANKKAKKRVLPSSVAAAAMISSSTAKSKVFKQKIVSAPNASLYGKDFKMAAPKSSKPVTLAEADRALVKAVSVQNPNISTVNQAYQDKSRLYLAERRELKKSNNRRQRLMFRFFGYVDKLHDLGCDVLAAVAINTTHARIEACTTPRWQWMLEDPRARVARQEIFPVARMHNIDYKMVTNNAAPPPVQSSENSRDDDDTAHSGTSDSGGFGGGAPDDDDDDDYEYVRVPKKKQRRRNADSEDLLDEVMASSAAAANNVNDVVYV